MNQSTPLGTVVAMVAAINQGNLQAAIANYESEARFVVQPGTVLAGAGGVSEAIGRMIALKSVLTADVEQTIENGDIALYCSRWRLSGTAADGSPVQMEGKSSDVLRRQVDGRWLIAIDNPWGPAILG